MSCSLGPQKLVCYGCERQNRSNILNLCFEILINVLSSIPGINCIPLLQRQLWLQMKRNAEESLQFLIKLINVYKALLCPL